MHHTLPRLAAATTGALFLLAGLGACSEPAEPRTSESTPAVEVTRLPTDEPSPSATPTTISAPDAPSPDPDDPDVATDAPQEPAPPAEPGTTTAVTVTFSYWTFDTSSMTAIANGYADVVDAEGTCTLTLERSGVTVAVDRVALPDARTTSCGEMAIQDPRLTSGTWDAHLTFASPSHSGTSTLVEIVVP